MKIQSASYNPFSDVRRTDFKVVFEVVDTNAKGAAQFSASEAAFGDLSHFQDEKSTEKYFPALEHNLWLLNGSGNILSDNENVGWWSATMSNDNAEYTAPPYISVYFGGIAISTVGLSINFDPGANQYPTKVRLTTYGADSSTVINSAVFDNDTPTAVFDFPSENYYHLKIEFLAAKQPSRRVRVSEIVFGVIQRYNADNVEKIKLKQSASAAAESIASTQLELTIDNSERQYDLLAPQNIFAFLQDGKQEMKMSAVVNGEEVDMGFVYYTSAKAGDGGMTATITGNDRMIQLDNVTVSGKNGTSTLQTLVNEILDGTGISAEFEGNLGATAVNMAIPENTRKREALRLLAQASACTAWMKLDGVLHFGNLPVASSEVQTLTGDDLYNFNGISISNKVDAVLLKVRNSYANTEAEYLAGEGTNVKTVNNPCVYSDNGQYVANWLLECYQRRRNYAVSNQGDPALEIGDTVKIYDAYGQNLNAAMTGFTLTFGGAIEIVTNALGGVDA